jgi:DNA-binding transcriptional ArsR family regulator
MESPERKRWLAIFTALASEPRLKIVEMLTQEGITCQQVLNQLELSQPAISYHLGKLEQAGILIKEKIGTRNCYRLTRELAALTNLLKE